MLANSYDGLSTAHTMYKVNLNSKKAVLDCGLSRKGRNENNANYAQRNVDTIEGSYDMREVMIQCVCALTNSDSFLTGGRTVGGEAAPTQGGEEGGKEEGGEAEEGGDEEGGGGGVEGAGRGGGRRTHLLDQETTAFRETRQVFVTSGFIREGVKKTFPNSDMKF